MVSTVTHLWSSLNLTSFNWCWERFVIYCQRHIPILYLESHLQNRNPEMDTATDNASLCFHRNNAKRSPKSAVFYYFYLALLFSPYVEQKNIQRTPQNCVTRSLQGKQINITLWALSLCYKKIYHQTIKYAYPCCCYFYTYKYRQIKLLFQINW